MRPPLLRFSLAIASVAIAVLLTFLLPPMRQEASLLLLLAAVVAGTWYGGRWPGLLATALAGLVSAWFLLPHSHPLRLGPDEWVQLGVFLFVALALNSLAAERDRVTARLRRSRDALEVRIEQRTDELIQANVALHAGAAVRLRAEEALSQFAAIEAATQDAVVTTTLEGRIVSCNPGAEKLYGLATSEFVGQSISLLLAPEASSEVPYLLERVSDGESIDWFESMCLRKDGTQVQVLLTMSPIMDAAGSVHGVSALGRDISRRKEAEKKIALYQQQLRGLAAALSIAEQQERRRIATELHDHLAQMLILSRVNIRMLQTGSASEDAHKMLDEIRHLLDQSIDYTRTLIWQMCPLMLHDLGLEAALEWLAEQIQEQHGVRVRFEDDEQPKPTQENVRVLLFQAVRELLMNVVKHARATEVIVAVCKREEQVEVRVEDDGVGFYVERVRAHVGGPEGGFGLFSIWERLDVVGGSFEVRSSPGAGTRATLRAPLLEAAGVVMRKDTRRPSMKPAPR